MLAKRTRLSVRAIAFGAERSGTMMHDRQVALPVVDIRPEAELVLAQFFDRVEETLAALEPPTAREPLEIPFGEQLHADPT